MTFCAPKAKGDLSGLFQAVVSSELFAVSVAFVASGSAASAVAFPSLAERVAASSRFPGVRFCRGRRSPGVWLLLGVPSAWRALFLSRLCALGAGLVGSGVSGGSCWLAFRFVRGAAAASAVARLAALFPAPFGSAPLVVGPSGSVLSGAAEAAALRRAAASGGVLSGFFVQAGGVLPSVPVPVPVARSFAPLPCPWSSRWSSRPFRSAPVLPAAAAALAVRPALVLALPPAGGPVSVSAAFGPGVALRRSLVGGLGLPAAVA